MILLVMAGKYSKTHSRSNMCLKSTNNLLITAIQTRVKYFVNVHIRTI